MSNDRFNGIGSILTLTLIVLLGLTSQAAAQKGGKGHGNGGGGGHGNGQGKSHGGDHGQGQRGASPQIQRASQGWGNSGHRNKQQDRGRGWQNQARQERKQREPNMYQEQQRAVKRQKPQHGWKLEQRQARSQPEWDNRRAPRMQDQHGNTKKKDRQVWQQVYRNNWPSSGPGNSDFGHSRKEYRHERRDERKYARDLRKEMKRNDKAFQRGAEYYRDRGYRKVRRQYPIYVQQYPSAGWGRYPTASRYYVDTRAYDQYYDDTWQAAQYSPVYRERISWTEQLLGAVMQAFLGDRLGGDTYVPDEYAYTDGQYYYSDPPEYYSSYNPDAYVYSPAGNYYPVPQFSIFDGGILNSSPLGYSSDPYSAGYVDDVYRQAYDYGYEQGYLAGQQEARYDRNAAYEDQNPYGYDDYLYDGYSVSLGQNRYYLNEGYDNGYREALQGRNDYELDSGGDFDLVSLLINGVLGMVEI
jgi:hypothetical protein